MKKRFPILILIITVALDMLGFGIIIPVLPIYADQLGAEEWVIGLIATSFAVSQFIFTPFWGGLSDRIGRKPVLLYSIAIITCSYFILSIADTLVLVFIARIIAGIGAGNLSVAQAFISDSLNPAERAKHFGYLGAAFGIGFILGPPLGGWLKVNFGIEGLGLVAGGISLLNLALVYFLLPESLKQKSVNSSVFRNPFSEIRAVLPRKELRGILLIHLLLMSALSMLLVTASLLWSRGYNQTEKEIGLLFAFVGIGAALIQGLLTGWLNRVFGERKLYISGIFIMAVGLTTLPFVPSSLFYILSAMALSLIAFGTAFVTPLTPTLLSQNANEDEQGRIMGLSQSVGALARIVGPGVGGILFGIGYFYPNIIAGAMLIFTGLIAMRVVTKVNRK